MRQGRAARRAPGVGHASAGHPDAERPGDCDPRAGDRRGLRGARRWRAGRAALALRAERADARRRRGARDAVDRLDASRAVLPSRISGCSGIIAAPDRRRRPERAAARHRFATAKREWERTFDAISDPIAVFNGRGELLRGNRALAEHLDLPVTGIAAPELRPGRVLRRSRRTAPAATCSVHGALRAGSVAHRGDAGRRADLQRHDVPDRSCVRRPVGRAGGEERHRGDRRRAAAAGR